MKNKFRLNMKSITKLFLLIILFSGINNATIINGRAILDSYNETFYSIRLQINTNTGNKNMGGATFVIMYDSSQLSFSASPAPGEHFIFPNFTGGKYSTAQVTKVLENQLWLNIELNTDNEGLIVSGSNDWTDLVILKFTKRTETPVEPIFWDTGSIFWSVYDGNNTVRWSPGTFSSVSNVEDQHSLPDNYDLLQNYPNPFNPTTTISFNLKSGGDVTLTVYNALGEVVETLINSNMNSGNHRIVFNASDISSGVYFYRLSVNNGYAAIKKMVLLK